VISAERARIDGRQALAHVGYLASPELEGRGLATKGIGKAAEYIAHQFWQDGLEPAGTGGSFFQPFDAPLVQEVTQSAVVFGRTSFMVTDDYVVLGGSASTAIKAPLLFVGYGISDPDRNWDDYAKLDAHGKIVVALDGLPDALAKVEGLEARLAGVSDKMANARSHGAGGFVLVSKKSDHLAHWRYAGDPLEMVCIQAHRRLVEQWFGSSIKDLEAEGPGRVASEMLLMRAELRRGVMHAFNVVGFLRGSDPELWKQIVVVGAHYDHIGRGFPEAWTPECAKPDPRGLVFPGADDNASGVAGLLELAEALAGEAKRPRRSIIFVAFSAEEWGLLGSHFFVEHPPAPMADVVAMINFDMIGRLRAANGLEVLGVATAPRWTDLLARANGEGLPLVMRATMTFDSDQGSFFVKGKPVLAFFTGFHADYHCISDLADRINGEGIAQIARLTYRLVREVADAGLGP
jgi:hypothetical protein